MRAFAAVQPEPHLEWGVAARPMAGEVASGDLHVMCPFEHGVLVGAVDALGHGPVAADVAHRAGAVLERHAREPLERIVHQCHAALQGTRGVVLSIASIYTAHAMMAWLGVGNVEAMLVAADAGPGGGRATLLTRGGVVGGKLPLLRPATIPLVAGDTLCFATDGIDPAFTADPPLHLPPQQWADTILARHGKRSDDALVLVVRILDVQRP